MSNKFVPYRLNYNMVSNFVDGIDPYNKAAIANGDLNNITTSEVRRYNSPSNLPSGVTGYVICRTTVYGENTVLQELQCCTSQNDTIYGTAYPIFTRLKSSGSWASWRLLAYDGSYKPDNGASQAMSKSFNIANWTGGAYLLTVTNAWDSSNRWGLSVYLFYKSTVYSMPLFTPIVEVEHAKISSFTIANDGTVTMTYDYNGYHVVNCRRI